MFFSPTGAKSNQAKKADTPISPRAARDHRKTRNTTSSCAPPPADAAKSRSAQSRFTGVLLIPPELHDDDRGPRVPRTIREKPILDFVTVQSSSSAKSKNRPAIMGRSLGCSEGRLGGA